jgi:hypothetical protein
MVYIDIYLCPGAAHLLTVLPSVNISVDSLNWRKTIPNGVFLCVDVICNFEHHPLGS